MSKSHRRRRSFVQRGGRGGAPPGTLNIDPSAPDSMLSVICYGADQFEEHPLTDIQKVGQCVGHFPVVWLNVDGLGNEQAIRKIGEVFKLHPLALEDALNTHERAKVDDYQDYLFITVRMVNNEPEIDTEQLSLVLGRNFVVTFQERPGDSFEPVRERLRKNHNALRTSGTDYLAYSLIDAVIDAFFPVLERYADVLDDLEDDAVATPSVGCITHIHQIKNDLILLRRAIWPQREVINTLLRDPHDLVTDETRLHLRDCYDHTVQIIDLVEVYREIASGLTELYVSSVSNRMNEVMKVLTVIATVFMPLTFVTSIYGMNFSHQVSPWNMPELYTYYGYPITLGVLVLITVGMVYFFFRKGWLRSLLPNRAELKRKDRAAVASLPNPAAGSNPPAGNRQR